MLTLTVKDVVSGDMHTVKGADKPYCIYVIREDDAILYVGRSNDPFGRLEEHFGVAPRSSGSGIGPIYKQFTSEAVHWLIDLYTIEECKQTTQGRCADVADAELDMIRHFKPCFNTLNNPFASDVPEKYLKLPDFLLNNDALDNLF